MEITIMVSLIEEKIESWFLSQIREPLKPVHSVDLDQLVSEVPLGLNFLSLALACHQVLYGLVNRTRAELNYAALCVISLSPSNTIALTFSPEEIDALPFGLGSIELLLLREDISSALMNDGEQYINNVQPRYLNEEYNGEILYRCFRDLESIQKNWEFNRCLYIIR